MSAMTVRTFLSTAGLAVFLGFLGAAESHAQSSSLFGSGSSSTGGRSGNSSLSNAANQSRGANSFGTGGAGGRGGTGAAGGGALSSGPSFGSFGQLSSTVGQSEFVGRGENSGRLVGSQNAGQAATGQSQSGFSGFSGRGGNSRNGGNARSGNQNRNQGFGANNAGTTEKKRPVPATKINFRFQTPAAEGIATRLEQRLANSRNVPSGGNLTSGIAVDLNEQGVATLQGTVSSLEHKSLIEAYVRLEPGVRSLKSELQVPDAAPAAN